MIWQGIGVHTSSEGEEGDEGDGVGAESPVEAAGRGIDVGHGESLPACSVHQPQE